MIKKIKNALIRFNPISPDANKSEKTLIKLNLATLAVATVASFFAFNAYDEASSAAYYASNAEDYASAAATYASNAEDYASNAASNASDAESEASDAARYARSLTYGVDCN